MHIRARHRACLWQPQSGLVRIDREAEPALCEEHLLHTGARERAGMRMRRGGGEEEEKRRRGGGEEEACDAEGRRAPCAKGACASAGWQGQRAIPAGRKAPPPAPPFRESSMAHSTTARAPTRCGRRRSPPPAGPRCSARRPACCTRQQTWGRYGLPSAWRRAPPGAAQALPPRAGQRNAFRRQTREACAGGKAGVDQHAEEQTRACVCVLVLLRCTRGARAPIKHCARLYCAAGMAGCTFRPAV